MSHTTSAMESSDSVYTFSFTTDWSQTVNAVAAASAPATAARRRGRRAGTHSRIQRSLTRNQHPAAIALVNAASRLMRIARSEEHTSELQSRLHLVCRLLLEKKNKTQKCTNTQRPFNDPREHI